MRTAKDPKREQLVSTSRLGRLVATGRSAVGLAGTMLRGRHGEVDLDAIARLTDRLGELRGLGAKLGQIVSFIDPTLPEEVRSTLARLQRGAVASEWSAVKNTVEQAFGPRAAMLLASLDPSPVAVASVGQVHRTTLAGYGPLAVKIRHPGIEQALRADFSTAIGGVAMANALTFGLARDSKALVDEARTAILEECDYRQEAAYQREFAAWLAGDAVLLVPEVIDAWSTQSVLTTRWEPGLTLEEFLQQEPTQAERNRAAEALFRAWVGGFHVLGLLHADPHPGNFAFRDGRVVLYDFGCVRRFRRDHTQAFAGLVRALQTGDLPALLAAAETFGFKVSGTSQAATFERFARAFFAPMLVRGPSVIPPDRAVELRDAMQDKLALSKLGVPAHLLFLLRLRFGLYAVLAKLGARLDWGALELELASSSPKTATG